MNHSAASTRVVSPAPRFRLADLLGLVGRFPLAIHQLLFWLAIAGVSLRAGLTKLETWESTVALFADEYKVPVLAPHVAAAMAATFEVGCSVLLLLGLGTRLAALPLIRHDHADPALRLPAGLVRTSRLGVDPALPRHPRRRRPLAGPPNRTAHFSGASPGAGRQKCWNVRPDPEVA